jgi:hypothetical protein
MKRSGIFQFLGYILAEAAQIAASFARLTGAKNLFITRAVSAVMACALVSALALGQRLLPGRCSSRGGGFFLFQLKAANEAGQPSPLLTRTCTADALQAGV